MQYYHFVMAERSDKCYKAEVVFLRRMMEEDYETYARLETAFFNAFQELEGDSLESYFKEAETFFSMAEGAQEPANEEGLPKVGCRNRKSAMFMMAHKMAKAIRKEGDDYKVTFGSCLKLVRQLI